ncbi:hypothetical protein B4U84_28425 [Westiellopsis prolifica IICB1]|nr:hypothetical protein B4U84_28425 [Westiellopsis prolifica IICB1]
MGLQIDTPLKKIVNLSEKLIKHIAQILTQQAIDTPQRKNRDLGDLVRCVDRGLPNNKLIKKIQETVLNQ